jgi:hypothetical protein
MRKVTLPSWRSAQMPQGVRPEGGGVLDDLEQRAVSFTRDRRRFRRIARPSFSIVF